MRGPIASWRCTICRTCATAIAASWQTLLIALVIYRFAPGFVLRLLVKFYPKDDRRRHELIAELYVVKRLWRLFWVADALGAVLVEGLPHRAADIRRKRREKRDSDAEAADAIELARDWLNSLPSQRDSGRDVLETGDVSLTFRAGSTSRSLGYRQAVRILKRLK
ncbi:hypothetical protein OG439_24610 [Amycolatopsis sp. NBC_01307]|uniref:hypothetical protein n=1 Tax=Amycolatopsis sp. NBC_01307 TaxID=2903561 RepID=UPI002E1169BE|nr:hypothetical protein OG439_24610 [Amycolatopsis sp. NBC_01307]